MKNPCGTTFCQLPHLIIEVHFLVVQVICNATAWETDENQAGKPGIFQ
jgi:hypothetical protein